MTTSCSWCPGEPFGKVEFAAASQGMQGVRVDGKAEIPRAAGAGRLGLSAQLPGGDGDTAGRQGRQAHRLHAHHHRKQPDGRWLLARDANLLTAGKT
jgi:hypothetical protein